MGIPEFMFNPNYIRAASRALNANKLRDLKSYLLLCPMCTNGIIAFRDEHSFKEWMISGLCQECQDGVFDNG